MCASQYLASQVGRIEEIWRGGCAIVGRGLPLSIGQFVSWGGETVLLCVADRSNTFSGTDRFCAGDGLLEQTQNNEERRGSKDCSSTEEKCE